MNTQILVIDLIRNWHKLEGNTQFVSKDLDNCTVTLVTTPVEFEGTEDFKVLILWDQIPDKPAVDSVPTALQQDIFNITKRFCVGVNAKIHSVVNDRHTTQIKLKSSAPKNVESFEWLDLEIGAYKDVE